MPRINVLVEVQAPQTTAFALHAAALESDTEAARQVETVAANLAGLGLDMVSDFAPVPMFATTTVPADTMTALAAFASPTENPDMSSASVVVAAEVDSARLEELRGRPEVVEVWPNSDLTLLDGGDGGPAGADLAAELFDLAGSAGGTDCRPFRPAVSIRTLRILLGVGRIWRLGFRGQNIVVGIIDEGIDGTVYPVVGGFSRPGARLPGTAPITSHGSMCAADVLVAAPAAKLYDYPFLGVPNSGGALTMFQAVLDQRRRDGTPHLTNNSYGFTGVPPLALFPQHEVHNLNHPLHRKVREVVASGAPAFFAAGNCGAECPSGNCQASGIGPGQSIHASNSLQEVITVAAVNSRHERIGYSSQGPGMFHPQKPDIAAYSHFFGNFGPGRPGGRAQPFDNGTSAATPVAAGVAALLLSTPQPPPSGLPLTPARLKTLLTNSAIDIGTPGWDADTGRGVINAAAAFAML